MRIKSMTATFGKLDHARLEPGPGLTLIHAPNEGGKSTWAAFWRTMLYGIDTRGRDKKGYLADKNHYQPWSGAPMEGEITLEYEGRDITIRRGPRGNTPFGAFSAVYTGTQEPVPGLTASNCGELLTGVGAEVFSRSAFLGDGNLSLTTAPELERRIAALVTSGEEDVSFSQAMDRLKSWKNRRQVNKSVGEIPKLEGELAQIRESLDQLGAVAAQTSRLEGERAALVRDQEELSRQLEAHRAIALQKLSDRYAQAEEEFQSAQRQLDQLEAERAAHPVPDREALKQAQGELQYLKVLEEEIKQGSAALEERKETAAQAKEAVRDERFPNMTGEEAAAKAAADCAGHQIASENSKRLKKWHLFLHLLGVLGFTALVFLGISQMGPLFIGLGGGFYILLVSVSLWALFRGKTAKKQAEEILSRYGVQTPEELTALAQGYRERCQAADKAAHEVEVIQNAVTQREAKREAARAGLLDFVHPFAPEVKDMFGCSAALSRALSIDHDLALARERAEERRRRLDDLAAQGAKPGEEAALPLPVPTAGLEETERALARTGEQLEQITAQLNQVRGTLQAMGDPAALSAQAERLEEKLARRRLECDALTAAMDALTQANAQLQERFSPELNRLTGQYMARLTQEKYPAVTLTRELEGFVRTADGVLPRAALYLSRGTADQLYLALRLAVCQLCLPEKPPILLDDALASFDDSRLEAALELLWELSGEQQLLLFTCQKREGEVLAGTPGVTKLTL
ncbi:MAG: AAA family ATPase [Lawsonibacter sp.]|jgi:uncharacterized protein YhaN|nr:AAA family ATPase [Lawsonibacter sp.]